MKTERINGPASRREFLRGGARYALLAGLGAVSATLVKRSGGQLSGQTCINQGLCRGCGAFEGCGLPQALSAKEFFLRSSRRLPRQSDAEAGAEALSEIRNPKSEIRNGQSLLTSAATEDKGDA